MGTNLHECLGQSFYGESLPSLFLPIFVPLIFLPFPIALVEPRGNIDVRENTTDAAAHVQVHSCVPIPQSLPNPFSCHHSSAFL